MTITRAGGNDVVNNGGLPVGPLTMRNNLVSIACRYRELGARKVNYVAPYTMTPPLDGSWSLRLGALYLSSALINGAASIGRRFLLPSLKPAFDEVIDLSDFDNSHRRPDYGCIIPEPTIKGAKEIAKRIVKVYETQSGSVAQETRIFMDGI
ncbi:hypothetical protein [Endozoicomonas atrinae]|uniref:hypothetical protein n=1 Tax=Endozoicomonas atrinae TaxID=1333660 RepID=UPI003B00E37A